MEHVLWQLKDEYLGVDIVLEQLATPVDVEPMHPERWIRIGCCGESNWRIAHDLKAKGYSRWQGLAKDEPRRKRFYST